MNTTKSRRFCYLLIIFGYPILAAVFAFLTVFIWIGDQHLSWTVLIVFACSGYFVWGRLAYARRIRKLYEKQAANMAGKMTLTPAGLRFERKNGTASVDYSWSGFESWLERPEMFMVFPGPLSFVRIPKDKLSGAEQDEVREWLSSAVKVS